MLIVGNWKMNYTNDLEYSKVNMNNQYVICPPFVFLHEVQKKFQGSQNISLGAQSVTDKSNNITGEISSAMLSHYDCQYCIVGHSERNVENYQLQIESLLEYDIVPILCVSSIDDKKLSDIQKNVIIAYEPISAIGTGNTAKIEDIDHIAKEIKNQGFQTILYGGSVTQESKLPKSIDGVLLGRKSLPVEEFLNFTLPL